jgi:lysine 2,3-aminomutase
MSCPLWSAYASKHFRTTNHIILENEKSEVSTETTLDINNAVEYIFEHSEINNVLLTGGDPLILSEKKLMKY